MDTYDAVVESGCRKMRCARWHVWRTVAMGLLAGVLIALGNAVMLVVRSDASLSPSLSLVISGACFSVGLASVMLCGAELFTGDVLMAIGCREGRYGVGDLCVVLGMVWVCNLVGAVTTSSLLTMGGFCPSVTQSLIEAKESLDPTWAFVRGFGCNMLVCLAVWFGHMRKSVTDVFAAALLPVTAFVTCGFEHSVANMYYLPMAGEAMMSNVIVVTMGNVVGGLAFCGLMALGHGRRGLCDGRSDDE